MKYSLLILQNSSNKALFMQAQHIHINVPRYRTISFVRASQKIINTNEWHSLEPLELYAIDLHKQAVTFTFTSFLLHSPMWHKLNDYFSLWAAAFYAHRVLDHVQHTTVYANEMEIPVEKPVASIWLDSLLWAKEREKDRERDSEISILKCAFKECHLKLVSNGSLC